LYHLSFGRRKNLQHSPDGSGILFLLTATFSLDDKACRQKKI